jgi:hypothetical protein
MIFFTNMYKVLELFGSSIKAELKKQMVAVMC